MDSLGKIATLAVLSALVFSASWRPLLACEPLFAPDHPFNELKWAVQQRHQVWEEVKEEASEAIANSITIKLLDTLYDHIHVEFLGNNAPTETDVLALAKIASVYFSISPDYHLSGIQNFKEAHLGQEFDFQNLKEGSPEQMLYDVQQFFSSTLVMSSLIGTQIIFDSPAVGSVAATQTSGQFAVTHIPNRIVDILFVRAKTKAEETIRKLQELGLKLTMTTTDPTPSGMNQALGRGELLLQIPDGRVIRSDIPESNTLLQGLRSVERITNRLGSLSRPEAQKLRRFLANLGSLNPKFVGSVDVTALANSLVYQVWYHEPSNRLFTNTDIARSFAKAAIHLGKVDKRTAPEDYSEVYGILEASRTANNMSGRLKGFIDTALFGSIPISERLALLFPEALVDIEFDLLRPAFERIGFRTLPRESSEALATVDIQILLALDDDQLDQ